MTPPIVAAVSRNPRPYRQRRRTIPCDNCGELREISYEHYRRIELGTARAPACVCESLPEVKVEEKHLRYWLRRYGAPTAELTALTASGYVAEHGLPGDLRDLAMDYNSIVPR